MHRNGKLHIFSSNHRAVTTATATAGDGNLRVSQKEFEIYSNGRRSTVVIVATVVFMIPIFLKRQRTFRLEFALEYACILFTPLQDLCPVSLYRKKKNIPSGIMQLKKLFSNRIINCFPSFLFNYRTKMSSLD